jgi:lipopolysaccharide biosynthesis regulator YciM
MNELLFLLLPLAFYSGWKASGKSLKSSSPEKRQLSDNFVRGVNFLLSEEPDKALDVFLNRPEIDEYTAETYLLLGNLFRNRGEVDRALSVHQNLIGRASLNRQQKAATMLALGQDFLAAGMMDRAEQVFTEVIQGEDSQYIDDAKEALRNIYEQTQEWEKAIEVTESSKQNPEKNLHTVVANYYCELAEVALSTGHIQSANEQLFLAKSQSPDSTRIKVITARIHTLQKQHSQASTLYLSAAKEAPRLLGSIFQPMIDSYEEAGRLNELQDELFEIYTQCSDVKVLEYTLRLSLEKGPSEKIKQELPNILNSKALNVRTIRQAVSLFCERPELGTDSALPMVSSALNNHLSQQPGYQCGHCGYKMHDFLWRCPACNHWDEVVHV